MKFFVPWHLAVFVVICSIPTIIGTILECKINNPIANAYCGDYCKSLNPGNHVAGSCAKDEVSCLCEMSNNKTIKVRVLQDQEPAPFTTESTEPHFAGKPLQPYFGQPIIRPHQMPLFQPQPPKQAQRLICDGSQIATTTCNSFCINAVSGSGGYCNVEDYTCRCKNVQFIKNEPIEAIYIPPQHEQERLNPYRQGNMYSNFNSQQQPKFSTEFNRLQPYGSQNPSSQFVHPQEKLQHQFQPPLTNIVPPPVQKPLGVQQQLYQNQQQQPLFNQGVPVPHSNYPPSQYKSVNQFSPSPHVQPYMDRPHGSQLVIPFSQQQQTSNNQYFQQVPQQQIISLPFSNSNFEPMVSPSPLPELTTPTNVAPVSQPHPQPEFQSETPPQFSNTESLDKNETNPHEQLVNVAVENMVSTEEQPGQSIPTEPITEIPETTILPPTSTTSAEQLDTTTSNVPLFSPPPFLYGWQGMPMRKINPLKRILRDPLCTAESCAKKCADRGFASCQSICNPVGSSTDGSSCHCLCSFGSSVKNSTI